MRILSKIKKNYDDIKNILKNNSTNVLDNIQSVTFNGSNLYILTNNLFYYNFKNDKNGINLLSGNVILNNPIKIKYSHDHIYVLDNSNIYNYNLLNDSYSLLIPGPINNFTVTGDHIIYDKFTQINRYHKQKKITYKLNGADGNVIDLVGDNQNIFLCYDTYVHRYNYVTGHRSNIITNISNVTSIAYDGILLYLKNKDSINVYTKDGLKYSLQEKLGSYQDIIFDNNCIIYNENGRIFKMTEDNLYYDFNVQNVDKLKKSSQPVCLKDGNLVLSDGNNSELYTLNFSNIVDYSYDKKSNNKFIIDSSNLYIIKDSTIEFPKTEILNIQDVNAYNGNGNNFVYSTNDFVINHVYQTPQSSTSFVKQFIYKNETPINALYFDNTNKDYYILDQNTITKFTKEFNDYTIEIQTHGTKFVPNMIGNLSVWLDSSDTNNIFTDINGTFTAKVGDNVALWKNKSNDHSQFASQSNISIMPKLSKNGGVYFSNTSFVSNFNLTMNYTIFLVTDPSQTPGYFYRLSKNSDYGPVITSMTDSKYNYHGDHKDIQLSSDYTYGKNIVSMVRSDNINTIGYYNGKKIFNIDGLPTTYSYNSIIDSIGNGISGNIYEMIIYTEVLDDRKRMLIEGYLADKWDIKTKLNADHPLFPYVSLSIEDFNIKNINGLTLWLDASDKKTVLDKNLKLVSNKNKISFWKDKSNNNYNIFGKNEPTYLTSGFNNEPTINFANSNYMMGNIPAGKFKNGITAFVVYEKDSNYNMQEGLISRGSSSSSQSTSNAGYTIDIYNNQRSPYGKSSYNISQKNTKNIFSYSLNKNSYIESVNGIVKMYKTDLNQPIIDPTSGFYIGTRNDLLTQFTGNISEIILFNRSLTDSEKFQVEGYLSNKWNLTASLSLTHPHTANLVLHSDRFDIINESNSIVITKNRINNIITESEKTIIYEKALLNNLNINQIEYNPLDGYLYLNDINSSNIYSINSNSTVEIIDTYIQNIHNIFYVNNEILLSNNKDLQILSDSTVKILNLTPNYILEYNDKFLIASQNYLLTFDKNFNQIDSISEPFYKRGQNTYIKKIQKYNDLLVYADTGKNKVVFLDNTNTPFINEEIEQLIDFDISIKNNTLYIATGIDSIIYSYDIINLENDEDTESYTIIIQLKVTSSLNQILNNLVKINNILYVDKLNGLLVSTNCGLYLLDKDLSTILRTYDNYNNLKTLIFKDDFIYTILNSKLIKYSIHHFLTQNNSYIFNSSIKPNFDSLTITNYNNPTQITTNGKNTYLLDNNEILQIKDIDIDPKMYSLYNYNYSLSANIIDMVQDNLFVYVLKDDNTLDVLQDNRYISCTYSNIPANKITIPNKNNDFYYISNNNKIMKYDSMNSNSIVIVENQGIDVDEQLVYYYDNYSINIYNKNNTGVTEIDDNIYYSNNSDIYTLNQNGSREKLEFENKIQTQINGLTNDESNIIVCTKGSVYKFDPYDYPILNIEIINNLNNPFKAIFANNNYYISDTFNHRIIKVDGNTLQSSIFASGLNYPRGIYYQRGNIYVIDSGIDSIIQFDANTGIQTSYSQTISGIIDLTFKSDLIYVTSLLQNIVYKIDTINNNSLSIYFNIDKPYYIDLSNNLFVSTQITISMVTLSYLEIEQSNFNKIINIKNLTSNNPLYNTNSNFKSWIDTQINIALNEKNIINQSKLYTKLEELLNVINASMEYMNLSTSILHDSLEDYKNKTQATLKSFSNKFNNIKS